MEINNSLLLDRACWFENACTQIQKAFKGVPVSIGYHETTQQYLVYPHCSLFRTWLFILFQPKIPNIKIAIVNKNFV